MSNRWYIASNNTKNSLFVNLDNEVCQVSIGGKLSDLKVPKEHRLEILAWLNNTKQVNPVQYAYIPQM